MLHIVGATRMSNCSAVVGDRDALQCLQATLDDALRTGSGGAPLYSSDGEPHAVVPIAKLANYPAAIAKANEVLPALSIGSNSGLSDAHLPIMEPEA